MDKNKVNNVMAILKDDMFLFSALKSSNENFFVPPLDVQQDRKSETCRQQPKGNLLIEPAENEPAQFF